MDSAKGSLMFDHVFVLCTGRCGSVTFTKSLAHATNYTSGHETRTHCVGAARFDYPPRHIEVDNRLSWFLGRLDRTYGDRAFYVRLTRDADEVARSFARREGRGIMGAYYQHVLMRAPRLSADVTPLAFAQDYVETVTENIRHFLRDKTHQMEFRVEAAGHDLSDLWARIGAEGALDAAVGEWAIRYNAS